MTIRDIGCVLRLFPYKEHGAIVSWCTAEHGIVRTVARSVLKPGSELSGVVDLFHECEVVYRTPAHGDLCTLASADLITPRLPLRGDLTKLRLASYMCRLLLSTVEAGAEDAHWHTLISSALDYTSESVPRVEILQRFEQRLAELHGLYSSQVPAHSALLRHFSHLPAGREELVGQLLGSRD